MVDSSSSAEQRSALVTLTALSAGALASLWSSLDLRDLPDALEQLVEAYGLAAGTLAADWYDALRDDAGVSGRFVTEPARIPSGGLFRSIADEVADHLQTALPRVQGELQRIVANAHRDTITQLSGRDPKASGWRRVGVGANCPFCRQLIGRGAVYKDSTSRFASHPHCNCIAAPAFDEGRAIPAMPYSAPTERQTEATRAKDAARVRAYAARTQ